jgi:hypothetical protein
VLEEDEAAVKVRCGFTIIRTMRSGSVMPGFMQFENSRRRHIPEKDGIAALNKYLESVKDENARVFGCGST